MKNYPDISTMIQFLEGTLPEEEMADLEIRALHDEALRQDLKMTRTLIRGIQESGSETTQEEKILKLRDHPVDELEESKIKEAKKEARVVDIRRYRKRILYPIAMVASVALLIMAGQWELLTGPSSPEQLFVKHFEPAPNASLKEVRSAEERPPTWEAYQTYDQQDFGQAAQLFEASIPESDRRLTDLFYLGNCYMELGSWDQAIAALEEVVQAKRSMSEDARWYLALAYLRNGEIGKATALLEEIKLPQNKAKKAHRILRKLQ